MKKLSIQTLGIIISSLIMLVSVLPFVISELEEEPLYPEVKKFLIFTFMLGFILLSVSLILRDDIKNGDNYNKD